MQLRRRGTNRLRQEWPSRRLTGSYPETLVLNASAVSDAPRVEWQVDSGVVWGASDTAV
jgi:hypothetical protein